MAWMFILEAWTVGLGTTTSIHGFGWYLPNWAFVEIMKLHVYVIENLGKK